MKTQGSSMPLFRDIQAVTFDVGGTLIRPWPSVGHVYGEVAARHGHSNITPEILNRQFAAAWRAKKGFDHSRPAWLALVKATFAGCLDKAAVQRLFGEIYDCFAAPEAWRIFDDVQPTLQTLRDCGFKLGIISNWDERLRPLLARLELDAYFDLIVISAEVGFAKPSCQIFQRAVPLLGVPPGSIVHVGDSLEEDVAGATAAGLHGLLLERAARRRESAAIRTLAELRDCINLG
jgi:putative hydrolase of the HAD superfamily